MPQKDAVQFLRYIAYIGEKYDPYFLFRPNLKDEEDNLFLELAIASQSKYLITHNTIDFASEELLFDIFILVTPINLLKYEGSTMSRSTRYDCSEAGGLETSC